MVHKLAAARSRTNHSGPPNSKRDSIAAFIRRGLVASKVALGFHRSQFDVFRGTTIITGENDDRVFLTPARLDRLEDLADGGVCFHDQVAIDTETTLTAPFGIGRMRRVRSRQREVEKKRT